MTRFPLRMPAPVFTFGLLALVFGAVVTTAQPAPRPPAQNPAVTHDDGHAHPAPSATRRPAAPKGKVSHVKSDKVCMVNDQHFGTPQIPVEVEGRTYYGCCEGCKATLAEDAKARTAVDPVSGKTVDKAMATIGAYPDGRVLYFENAANLKAWNRR